jgi:serine/threonine-protein kinase
MYNKFFSPAVIIITISTLSLVSACSMPFDIQSKEAMAQTTEQSNSTNFLTYENPIFGIRMLYPANWDKLENASSSNKNSTLIDLVTFGPQSNNRSDTTGKLIVKVDNISDIKPIALSDYANDIISDLRQDFKVAESTTTLAGLPAYKFEYTGTEESVDLQAMMILTIKGDKAYIISYTADPEIYPSYLPTVQKMIDSIEILK